MQLVFINTQSSKMYKNKYRYADNQMDRQTHLYNNVIEQVHGEVDNQHR